MYSKKKNPVFCFHRWSRKGYAVFASLHKVVMIGVVTFGCTLVQLRYDTILAQATDSISPLGNIDLNEIEISGDQPLIWSPLSRSVSVMERREINASPARSIDDILKQLPGVDVRQRGSDGTQADLSIRGGSFDQVLILLNGVNITDPQTGHYNLDLPVDLHQIQRIEILQGSGARVWGPNAFCGVINLITTPQHLSDSKTASVDIGAGSFGYQSVSGSLQWNGKNRRFNWLSTLSASGKHSDGYIDNTDFDLFNSHFEVLIQNKSLGRLNGQIGYQQKGYGANSFYSFAYPNQFERTKSLFSSLNWEKTKGKNLFSAQISNRLHHDRFELFRNAENAATWYTGPNFHLTRTTSGKVQVIHGGSLGKTIVGIDMRNEHILSNVLGEALSENQTDYFDEEGFFNKKKSRTNLRAFADHTLIFKKLSLSGGGSVNHHTDFGTYCFGGMDLKYSLTENLQLGANLNQSFRLPTFTDLYYKSATQTSNPDLNPEKSTTYEVFAKYEVQRFQVAATAFHRAGKNVIDWVKHPDSTKWVCQNETALNANGIDLSAEYQNVTGFIRLARIGWSGLYMDKTATGYDSKYALDYLRNKFNLHLEAHLFGNKRIGFFTSAANASWQDRAGTYTDFTTQALTSYKPCTLADIRISWQHRKIGLHADVNNLLDTQYADFGGLTQPGRSIRFGLSYSLQ
jgi:vitamin B12 transporter